MSSPGTPIPLLFYKQGVSAEDGSDAGPRSMQVDWSQSGGDVVKVVTLAPDATQDPLLTQCILLTPQAREKACALFQLLDRSNDGFLTAVSNVGGNVWNVD